MEHLSPEQRAELVVDTVIHFMERIEATVKTSSESLSALIKGIPEKDQLALLAWYTEFTNRFTSIATDTASVLREHKTS